MSKLSDRGDSHDKSASTTRKPWGWQNVLVARQLSLYDSQFQAWCSKQQQQLTSSERESELVAENACPERDEELAILQKAATNFTKRLKYSMSFSKSIGLSLVSKPCVVYFGLPAAAGMSGDVTATNQARNSRSGSFVCCC